MAKYKSYSINSLDKIPQISNLDQQEIEDIKVVGEIYPFKTNNYVIDRLINWKEATTDPIFRLNFPHRDMLIPEHYDKIKWGMENLDKADYKQLIHDIRLELNPHPAGQKQLNIPMLGEEELQGVQHKYHNIVLFFPSSGQTCHAYCTFCFRWPQFVNEQDFKIQAKEVDPLIQYLKNNPQVDEVLITGGDPMIMNARVLSNYIEPLLQIDSIKSIRIGTKSITFWPHKYVDDPDAENVLNLFRKIVQSGKHLAFMAHFNHWVELDTEVAQEAIFKIRQTGAEIRTQAPLLRHINNSADIWHKMIEKQVQLSCIPYYMFLPRDTGAQHYFAETLSNAVSIYKDTIRAARGIARTLRGPVMSARDGKVEVLDLNDGLYTLRFLRHRDPSLSYKVFTATAIAEEPLWFDDLAYDPQFDYQQDFNLVQ